MRKWSLILKSFQTFFDLTNKLVFAVSIFRNYGYAYMVVYKLYFAAQL